VTEFSVGDQQLYLSPLMDFFDRQIISYAIGTSPNLEVANGSLREALATLKDGQKPLVLSDQGFQYQHRLWRLLLQNAGAVQSMSRKANCYDNAVMESFFGHLKEELFNRVRFGRRTDCRAARPCQNPQHGGTGSSAARIHPLV
jgi:putative transposase